MADYNILLGVELDTSNIKTEIEKYNNQKIDLGVNVKTSEIRKQISQYNGNSNNAKLHLKVKLDETDLKKQIRKLNDTKTGDNALKLNTDSLEKSLNEVNSTIKEIRTTLGSLDNVGDLGSIVGSINQIGTALDKASGKVEEFGADLKALVNKNFDINIGLDMGQKKMNTIGYGRAARKQVIPELEAQIKYLENLHGGQQAAMKKFINNKDIGFDIFTDFNDFNSDSAIKKMEAMERYINALKKLSTVDNVDLSGFNDNFSKSASELINDITGVENAVDKAEDTMQKLKGIFGGSVDGDSLTRQLDSVVADLGEIKTAIQGLSSSTPIDGLVQSFNRLSETLDRVVANFATVKSTIGNELTNAISDSGVVKDAQQTGQNIGEAISKSAKQSINLDDVIDKEVLRLMDEYAISGRNSSKAFDEIRQSIVDFRSGIGDINQVTSAISNNMKVVNEAKNDYKDLAEHIKMFNASGAKVHLQDSIKQEYGDDFESMRKQLSSGRLGNAFTTGKGMDFETFIEETNSILGQTIDLSHGAEAAFGDLVRKINSTKSSNYLTGDDLFRNGILDMGDVVANVSTSLEQIENSEEEIARTSTAVANTIVQNEERKQQAYQNTAKLISDSAQKTIDSVSSKSINKAFMVDESDSIKFRREMENLVNQWTNNKGKLTDIKIDTTTVYDKDTERNIEKIRQAQVTYNNELGETIKKTIALRQIGTEVNVIDGKEVTTPISGFVEVAGQYSKTLGKTRSQTDAFVKQQKNAVSDITNTINQLNRAAIDQNRTRPIKEDAHLTSLKNKYDDVISAIQRMRNASNDNDFQEERNNVKTLISEYKSLRDEYRNAENVSSKMKGTDFGSGLDIAKNDLEKFKAQAKDFPQITRTIEDLDKAIENVGDASSLNKFNDQLRVARSELAKIKSETTAANRSTNVGTDISKITSKIKDIQRISPEIDQFKTNINGAEVSVESLLNDLSKVKTSSDFSVVRKRFESFKEAAQAAGIAVREISTKAKSVEDIKFKLDDTGFDGFKQEIQRAHTEADRLKKSLSGLDVSFNELDSALRRLDAAMESVNFADEANDAKKLVSANKEYEAALKQVYSQLKLNQQIEKDSNKNTKLNQEKAKFALQLDKWLQDNSSAAKEFGTRIHELRNQISACDDIKLGNLKREFQSIDREADLAGKKTKTFTDRIKDQFHKYSAYFGIAEIFMYAEQGLRDMFEQVKLIDSAMTELKKVTDETDSSYNQFLTNAASRAKEIGTTIDGLVSSTADFARLGYDFADAQGLAEVANIYTVVGDEIDGVETATQSLISTMAAFKDEMNGMSDADFAMDIVDKFNEVSNNFSISSGGIGEALTRSASSLASANNTLDESIALITAAM